MVASPGSRSRTHLWIGRVLLHLWQPYQMARPHRVHGMILSFPLPLPSLSPPNETIPPSFSFIGTNVEVPIGGDLVSTVTDIDISAYPFLPESLFPHSTNLQLPDEKNNPAYVFRHGQRTSSSTTPPQLWSLPLIHFLSNVRPDVFHPNSTRKMLFRS